MANPASSVTCKKEYHNEIRGIANGLPALPSELIEHIFTYLMNNPQDLVHAAQSCRRTYSVLLRLLARYPSVEPLEKFLNVLIAHNRFDKVLPPLRAVSEPNPLALSLCCNSELSAENINAAIRALSQLRTLRLHVCIGDEATSAFTLISNCLINHANIAKHFL